MTEQRARPSPDPKARLIGVVYLLYFVTAVGGEFFLKGIVVHDDASATANNILAHQAMFRLGLAASLVSTACYVALTGLFYRLFEPTNRSVSFTAALFSLVGCTILALGSVFRGAPLLLLAGHGLRGVTPAESWALVRWSLDLHAQCLDVCFVFFGVYCLLIGYLIFGSAFLPRILGAWMMLAGLGWLLFLAPPLAYFLRPYIAGIGFLAEFVLMLWLLVMGVEVRRRNQHGVPL